MTRKEINEALSSGWKVANLIEALQQFPPDAPVIFSEAIGDYNCSKEAMQVVEVDMVDRCRIVESGYSSSKIAIGSIGDDEDDELVLFEDQVVVLRR
jgi:hypothetical protein